jgi:hypothetical protein
VTPRLTPEIHHRANRDIKSSARKGGEAKGLFQNSKKIRTHRSRGLVGLPAKLHQLTVGVVVAHDFIQLLDAQECSSRGLPRLLLGFGIQYDPHLGPHQDAKVLVARRIACG